MEIDRSGFIDVYVLKTLNEIKESVKTYINLDLKREEETDQKVSIVLKDLINSNFKNLQIDPGGNLIYTLLPIVDDKENSKIRMLFSLYYAALYYDNTELLQDLLKEDINFTPHFITRYEYLDKSVSSKFDRKEYIEYIKVAGDIIHNFIYSIRNLSEEEREKYIVRFVKLFKLRYEDIHAYLKTATRYDDKFKHLFDKNNLDHFEDETYKKSDINQLHLIDWYHDEKLNKETCDRLNNLMQNKGFTGRLCNLDLMMRLYTDEELGNITCDMSHFLDKHSENMKTIRKAQDFIKLRPDLVSIALWIPNDIFDRTSNYILIEALDYMAKHSFLFDEHNLAIFSKTMAPRAGIKRVLGLYNK